MEEPSIAFLICGLSCVQKRDKDWMIELFPSKVATLVFRTNRKRVRRKSFPSEWKRMRGQIVTVVMEQKGCLEFSRMSAVRDSLFSLGNNCLLVQGGQGTHWQCCIFSWELMQWEQQTLYSHGCNTLVPRASFIIEVCANTEPITQLFHRIGSIISHCQSISATNCVWSTMLWPIATAEVTPVPWTTVLWISRHRRSIKWKKMVPGITAHICLCHDVVYCYKWGLEKLCPLHHRRW